MYANESSNVPRVTKFRWACQLLINALIVNPHKFKIFLNSQAQIILNIR